MTDVPLPPTATPRIALHHAGGLPAPATGAGCVVDAPSHGDPGPRRRRGRGRPIGERRIYLSQKRAARARPLYSLSVYVSTRSQGGDGRAGRPRPGVLRAAGLLHRRSELWRRAVTADAVVF